jgi:hypothetical protein
MTKREELALELFYVLNAMVETRREGKAIPVRLWTKAEALTTAKATTELLEELH